MTTSATIPRKKNNTSKRINTSGAPVVKRRPLLRGIYRFNGAVGLALAASGCWGAAMLANTNVLSLRNGYLKLEEAAGGTDASPSVTVMVLIVLAVAFYMIMTVTAIAGVSDASRAVRSFGRALVPLTLNVVVVIAGVVLYFTDTLAGYVPAGITVVTAVLSFAFAAIILFGINDAAWLLNKRKLETCGYGVSYVLLLFAALTVAATAVTVFSDSVAKIKALHMIFMIAPSVLMVLFHIVFVVYLMCAENALRK